jgi:hypothetical protein
LVEVVFLVRENCTSVIKEIIKILIWKALKMNDRGYGKGK